MSPHRQTSRRQRRRIHPLVIALTTILLTIFVIYYAFNQGLPFQSNFTLHALVRNSVNVRSGSPVRIAGIDVGVVQGVSPAGNLSSVSFTVDDNGLPVHKDATITIRSRLFLEGGYYLDLNPGSPSAPVLGSGSTLQVSHTLSPVQFYQVLSSFDIAARTSFKNVLNTLNEGFSAQPGQPLSDSGAGGLKMAAPELKPVFKDTAWITRGLRGTHAGDVERLLSSASLVTGALAETSPQLTDLVSALNRAAGALASTDGAIAQSISGLDQTLQVAPAALTSIDHALPPLATLAQTLDPSLRVSPPIIDALTSTVEQLAAALAPAERTRLLASLKTTFEEFPTILRQLSSAFPITKQVTDCLSTHVVPQLKKVVPDGPLSTNRPVWQDFIHFLPNVGGATGGFDANGPWTRIVVGAGSNTLTGGTLGNLPGIGQLIGSAPPGNGSLLGARPSWVGDLQASDFRPDVPCATQKLPSLVAPTKAADLQATDSSTAPGPATALSRTALSGGRDGSYGPASGVRSGALANAGARAR